MISIDKLGLRFPSHSGYQGTILCTDVLNIYLFLLVCEGAGRVETRRKRLLNNDVLLLLKRTQYITSQNSQTKENDRTGSDRFKLDE
jgi:hypothetical protein